MKYNWSEKQCDEVMAVLDKCIYGHFTSSSLRKFIAKLDPRPNYQELNTCYICGKWGDCKGMPNGTCGNFERDEPELITFCVNCKYDGGEGCTKLGQACPYYEQKKVEAEDEI